MAHRLAIGLTKHEIPALTFGRRRLGPPERTRGQPLLQLSRAMGSQCHDQRGRQGDHALAGSGFDIGQLWSVAGPLRAAHRPLPACRRSTATVEVARPRHGLADRHRPGVRVDLWPGQGERLALTEAGGQGQHPAGRVASVAGGLEQATRFVLAERFDLLRPRGRRVDERADVAGQQAALHRHHQRPGQAAVHLEHAGAVEAWPLQTYERRLDLLGGQLAQADPTKVGHQVPPDDHLLRAERGLADAPHLDVWPARTSTGTPPTPWRPTSPE